MNRTASLLQIKTATNNVAKYAVARNKAYQKYQKERKRHTKFLNKFQNKPMSASQQRQMIKSEARELDAGIMLDRFDAKLRKAEVRLNQLTK